MARNGCVVLGDVVGSRDIADRNAFQRELADALSSVNETYESAIDAPFSILKGVDEIGGVLDSVRPIAGIQRSLTRALHPERIRIATVVGEIDVNADANDVAAMDGSALRRADLLLSELESADLTFRLSGNEPAYDDLISDEINLLDMIRADWSDRQHEVITTYERLDSQKAVAEALDVTPQAVSNALRDSKGSRVLRIEARLEESLQSYPDIPERSDGE